MAKPQPIPCKIEKIHDLFRKRIFPNAFHHFVPSLTRFCVIGWLLMNWTTKFGIQKSEFKKSHQIKLNFGLLNMWKIEKEKKWLLQFAEQQEQASNIRLHQPFTNSRNANSKFEFWTFFSLHVASNVRQKSQRVKHNIQFVSVCVFDYRDFWFCYSISIKSA